VPERAEDSQIRVLLLDIEGTTTPVDFVYKTLFPYASRKVEAFLFEHFRDREIQAMLAELAAQHQRDDREGARPPVWHQDTDEALLHSSAAYVHWLMARNSKCTPLKTLQGKIWHQGYAGGELHGEVYADVPPAFERWRRQGREICIYSSGSVLAQQLLFRSTISGDLTTYISAFYDTGIGAKTESDSYRRIAESRHRAASEVLFISDAIREIEAARLAGLHADLCVRQSIDTDKPRACGGSIHTFEQIMPD
jgi:enolase-phosphatase E1